MKQFLVAISLLVMIMAGCVTLGYLTGQRASFHKGYLAGVGIFVCDHMLALVATDQFGHLAVVTPHDPRADQVARAVKDLPEGDLTRVNLEVRCQTETQTSWR